MYYKRTRVRHKNLKKESPEIFTITEKWRKSLNSITRIGRPRQKHNLYNRNWVINNLDDVKEIDSNFNLSVEQKWDLYKNYISNANSKTVDEYIKHFEKSYNKNNSEEFDPVAFINNKKANYLSRKLVYIPTEIDSTEKFYKIQFLYALNHFLEFGVKNSNQTLEEYIKNNIDSNRYKNVINNFSIIRDYSFTEAIMEYIDRLPFLKEKTAKKTSNLFLKLTRTEWLKIFEYLESKKFNSINIPEDHNLIENWLNTLLNKNNSYSLNKIKKKLNLILMKALLALDEEEQLREVNKILIYSNREHQTIAFENYIYFTKIIKYVEEKEKFLTYENIIAIVLGSVSGRNWLNESIRSPEVLWKLIKKHDLKFIDFFTRLIFKKRKNNEKIQTLDVKTWLSIEDNTLFKLSEEVFLLLSDCSYNISYNEAVGVI